MKGENRMQMFLQNRLKKLIDAQEIGKIRMDEWEIQFVNDLYKRSRHLAITLKQKEKICQVWERYERDAL